MTEFRGILFFFVDITSTKAAASLHASGAEIFGTLAVGQPRWFEIGWAVGNNARRTYCGRASTSKMLSFVSFTEAKNFIRTFGRRRQDHHFYMVYEADGQRWIVSSLEEIQKLDESLGQRSRLPDDVREDVLNRLVASVGKVVATRAIELRAIIKQDGEAAARTRFSDATYYRLRDVLCEAGLTIP